MVLRWFIALVAFLAIMTARAEDTDVDVIGIDPHILERTGFVTKEREKPVYFTNPSITIGELAQAIGFDPKIIQRHDGKSDVGLIQTQKWAIWLYVIEPKADDALLAKSTRCRVSVVLFDRRPKFEPLPRISPEEQQRQKDYLKKLGFKRTPEDPLRYKIEGITLGELSKRMKFNPSEMKREGGIPLEFDTRWIIVGDFHVYVKTALKGRAGVESLNDPETPCIASILLSEATDSDKPPQKKRTK